MAWHRHVRSTIQTERGMDSLNPVYYTIFLVFCGHPYVMLCKGIKKLPACLKVAILNVSFELTLSNIYYLCYMILTFNKWNNSKILRKFQFCSLLYGSHCAFSWYKANWWTEFALLCWICILLFISFLLISNMTIFSGKL